VFAWTVFVDDFWKILLAHTAFAGNEHRQISGSHLNSNADGTVQFGVKADDSEALFDG